MIPENNLTDFRLLRVVNVPDVQQPSTAKQIEFVTPKIKPLLPVIFSRLTNVDVIIEEKSSGKIGILKDPTY